MKIESGQEGNVRTVRAYGEPLPKGIELGSDFMRAVAGNFMVRVDYDYGSAIAVAFSKDALREWYLG